MCRYIQLLLQIGVIDVSLSVVCQLRSAISVCRRRGCICLTAAQLCRSERNSILQPLLQGCFLKRQTPGPYIQLRCLEISMICFYATLWFSMPSVTSQYKSFCLQQTHIPVPYSSIWFLSGLLYYNTGLFLM